MKRGDFIRIDFVGRVAATGEVFDFTPEDVAKKEGLHNAKHIYAPVLVIIGDRMVIPGVEKRLMTMKAGEEQEFTVPPEEAFGPRNPRLVRVFPIAAFLRKNINPTPGNFVEIEGMRGKVQSVSSGRVRVDFNNPLAGKELKYWVKVREKIDGPGRKVDALFSHYNILHTAELKDSTLTVRGKNIQHETKKFIRKIIEKWVPEVKTVTFGESKKEK